MIVDNKTLEFDKIKELIGEFSQSELGNEEVKKIAAKTDFKLINLMLLETDQALRLVYKYGTPNLRNHYDILPSLKRVSLEASLNARELRNIAMHLFTIKSLKKYLISVNDLEGQFESFKTKVDNLFYDKRLYQEINNAIDENCEILDSASFNLAGIRNKIKKNEEKIQEKLQEIVQTQKNYLTDTLISKRNDRYVVRVKIEYKNKFKGFIQDYSQSGETAFMEPAAITDITNKIQILKNEQELEIIKILKELSTEIVPFIDTFKSNSYLLTELDLIFSKAQFAKKYRCVKPKISPKIKLLKARHPLIDQKEVVANDIVYDDNKCVIITGPNTGGKTVALKTLGLLAIMAQAGILIPVAENSEIKIFSDIFADIGDEQSIEQSLSTFSSHMTNIIRIVKNAHDNSLIILDELGSGTDPKEGSSLAVSLIKYFLKKNTYIMATTHYPELKVFAFNEDKVVNASTKFDIETLSPTYKLAIGIPGSSNAFEISRRLGLEEEILSLAKEENSTSESDVTKLLNTLAEKTKRLDDQSEQLQKEQLEVEKIKTTLKNELSRIETKKQNILREVDQKAKEVVENAKIKADKIIKELLKYNSEVKMHQLTEKKTELKNIYKMEVKKKKNQDVEYLLGDLVKVITYNQNGQIIKILANNNFEIRMGILTTKVHKNNLEFIQRKEKQKVSAKINFKNATTVGLELDLRGERLLEALIKLDKYIDDLIINKINQASIIHGHGTNVLKKGIQEHLKKNKYIESFAYGKAYEGGSGVTVITLKV